VLRRARDGSPLVVENRVGRGTVIFSTDPIELHSVTARRESDLALYRSVLEEAGVHPIGLQPDDPLVHTFRVPMQDGGQVYVLFNTDDIQPARRVTLQDCQAPLTLSIASKRPGLLWFDGRGALRAVEAQGACNLGDKMVLEDETGGTVLSLDRQDIRRSRALLLMPLHSGSVHISTDHEWNKTTALTGDLHDGKWRTCETAPAGKSEAGLVVNVSLDQVFSLLLLTEPGNAPKWCKAIEDAMTDPASLR